MKVLSLNDFQGQDYLVCMKKEGDEVGCLCSEVGNSLSCSVA